MKLASEGSGGYGYGYPPYSLVGGSPRGSSSGKSWRPPCPVLRISVIVFSVLAVGAILFLFWPVEPDVEVRHVKLDGINIMYNDSGRRTVLPPVQLDVNLKLDLTITNRNFFGANYDRVVAQIKYRGDELGQVESTGGRVPARSSVKAVAALELEGKELFEHVSELLIDVANRELPLEVEAVFSGAVEILFFQKHEQVTVSCDLLIDPKDKVLLRQSCSLV